MRKIKQIGERAGISAILFVAILAFFALALTGAAKDDVILEQINKNLSTVNETVNYLNETAPPAILSMEDIGKILALLFIIAAAGILIMGLIMPDAKFEKVLSSSDAKCESVGRIVAIALVFLLLILAAILIKESVITAGNEPTYSSIWAAIIILAIVFLLLIYLGFAVDGTLDQGEMRRAIAGTFVLGFTMLIFFLSRYEIQNKEVVTAYLQMVGVIIGFYFGAKTALAGAETKGKSPVDEALDYAKEAEEDADSAKKLIATVGELTGKGVEASDILTEAERLVKSAESAAAKAEECANKAKESEHARNAAKKANDAANGARAEYDKAKQAA